MGIAYAMWTSNIYGTRTFWGGGLGFGPYWRKHKMRGGGGFSHATWTSQDLQTRYIWRWWPMTSNTWWKEFQDAGTPSLTSLEHHEIFCMSTFELVALWMNTKPWPTIYAWRPFYLRHVNILRSTRSVHLEVGGLWLWSVLNKAPRCRDTFSYVTWTFVRSRICVHLS